MFVMCKSDWKKPDKKAADFQFFLIRKENKRISSQKLCIDYQPQHIPYIIMPLPVRVFGELRIHFRPARRA